MLPPKFTREKLNDNPAQDRPHRNVRIFQESRMCGAAPIGANPTRMTLLRIWRNQMPDGLLFCLGGDFAGSLGAGDHGFALF